LESLFYLIFWSLRSGQNQCRYAPTRRSTFLFNPHRFCTCRDGLGAQAGLGLNVLAQDSPARGSDDARVAPRRGGLALGGVLSGYPDQCHQR